MFFDEIKYVNDSQLVLSYGTTIIMDSAYQLSKTSGIQLRRQLLTMVLFIALIDKKTLIQKKF